MEEINITLISYLSSQNQKSKNQIDWRIELHVKLLYQTKTR